MASVATAEGLLSLIQESEVQLQAYSLQRLASIVDSCWPVIAEHVSRIEELYENDQFPDRELASIIASKIYFYLGEYEEAMNFSLTAGRYFDLRNKDDFTQTIYFLCVDAYIAIQQQENDVGYKLQEKVLNVSPENKPKLVEIVEKVISNGLNCDEYKSAIGIAIESRRLDIIEKAIELVIDQDIRSYILVIALDTILPVEFRNKILRLVLKSCLITTPPEYYTASKCIVHLEDIECAVLLLESFLRGDDEFILVAYQIAFDFENSASQDFLIKLTRLLISSQESNLDPKSPIEKVRKILSGEVSTRMYLEFLYRNINLDMYILNTTHSALEARSSLFHSSVTFANAFMHNGTSCDTFLRSNLEWLSRASNWCKFSATAALGVIHKGNLNNALFILRPYLPKEAESRSSYSEGGSLYALGLIHANHGHLVAKTLIDYMNTTEDVVIQHGASLGLGVACLGTGDENVYEELKTLLFNDSAISGESAALAMGLVMLGRNTSSVIDEMMSYAHETQHGKIIRGLALGIALLAFGTQDSAERVIDLLANDGDPILRYGGMFAISMAYAGSGNNKAVKRLLHFAVSDVNDDVRRAAVIGIGFIMFRNPEAVPSVVELIIDSYNPHVRYGSALALGISCVGTAMPSALKLLKGLVKDTTDFVRQGAMISIALILMQQNEHTFPEINQYRKIFSDSVQERHEDAMAKFGAVLAQGIIDAGGRNATVTLQTPLGSINTPAVVGIMLFIQYWYWFPLTLCLSLSFTPTGLIALNKDMKAPKFGLISNAKPSKYSYPPKFQAPSSKKHEKFETAILSTTARAQARAKKINTKEVKDDEEMKDVEILSRKDEISNVDQSESIMTKESNTHDVENFTRVLPLQQNILSLKETSRYKPIRKLSAGIMILLDRTPNEAQDCLEFLTEKNSSEPTESAVSESEATMPQEFDYPFED